MELEALGGWEWVGWGERVDYAADSYLVFWGTEKPGFLLQCLSVLVELNKPGD